MSKKSSVSFTPLRRLFIWSIRHPCRSMVLMSLFTLCAVPGLLRLEVRTDGHALVPQDDPAILMDSEIRQHFNLQDPVIVFIESTGPEGIYNTETLRVTTEVTNVLAEIAESEGIGSNNVMSLYTERRDRVYPGSLRFRPFLDPLPENKKLLDVLESDVNAASIIRGTLVSSDEKATVVLLNVPLVTGGEYSYDRTALCRRVAAAVKPFETEANRIRVVGAPVAEALLGLHIIEDLAVLVPLAITTIALILWLGCRRFWGVVLGLTEIGACLLWTFGLMGVLGVPIYLTTAVLPVILVTIGLADEIHVFWHYQHLLRRNGASSSPGATLRETYRDMVRPIALTSLTTVIGFLSFGVSPIAPVRYFGLFAAAGILFCLLWSLTVIPAALALLPAEKMRHPHSSIPATGSWTERWIGPLLQHRTLVQATLILVTVAVAMGAKDLFVQDSWVDGFAQRSPFRIDTDRVNASLFGTHILLAHLTLDPPIEKIPRSRRRQGALLDPEAVEEIGLFENFVRAQPGVGGVLGPYSHLTSVAYLWLGRKEERRRIPDTPELLETLIQRFEVGRGIERRREVIDDELRRAVVTIFLKDANYRQTSALMKAIRNYERQNLTPRSIRLDFAGDVAVSQAMIPAIVKTQVYSLFLALVGALATVAFLYRSARCGIIAVLPAAVSILWVFGTMGWLGMPLGVATSMFCAIILGISIDYAIHFLERFNAAKACGHAAPELLALREAGPAIVVDALAIALGFGLLSVSQVPANGRLGLLVALALLSGCLLTLLGLGTILTRGKLSPSRRRLAMSEAST